MPNSINKHFLKALAPRILEECDTHSVIPHSKCKIAGCDNHKTIYLGLRKNDLCEHHQRMLREYGGWARYDRPWSFHKKDYCEDCGHQPKNNPLIAHEDEHTKNILGRMMLDVDHIDMYKGDRYDPGSPMNHPDNLRTRCKECHKIKTLYEGDHFG